MVRTCLLFTLVLFYGCVSIDVSSWGKNYNPTTDSRIRIIAKEKELKEEYQGNEYHTYKYRIMVKENGHKKYYGFKPSYLMLFGGNLNASNVFIGVPETKNSKYCTANKTCYIREFIVSANDPVYIGRGYRHWCDNSWFFPDCYSRYYDDILLPKAGRDYEILGYHHVYEVSKDGKRKKIETEVYGR